MSTHATSFRVGKVLAYLRGQTWYLCYHENGQRRRPRVGPHREAARQLAAQINGQLAVGAPAALSFEAISITDLRERWLQHHDSVVRSSPQTICRYRTATDHLLRHLEQNPVRHASQFNVTHAEAFVRYLRSVEVSPNGHPNAVKRPLMDKGVRFVLESCRAMFNYAIRRRCLPPYAENPFHTLEIDRIPIERMRPVELLTAEQERAILEACDDWQFPLYLTLMLTGLRSGELCHLLLPDDLDLEAGLSHVRNKPQLGWQVKTRNERDVPLVPKLVEVLRVQLGGRRSGPVFRQRGATKNQEGIQAMGIPGLEKELLRRVAEHEAKFGRRLLRQERLRLAQAMWCDLGAIDPDRIRREFMGLIRKSKLSTDPTPKVLRHLFATTLQEGRVDPLIRNQLMGHAAVGERTPGHGLGMTAVYTHSRPETVRMQLEMALVGRAAMAVADAWLCRHRRSKNS